MRTTLRYSLLLILFSFPALKAWAYDQNIPAGTLMECTLSEPNFSSATTSVGDPFLCYPRNLSSFGRSVFPRGSYIVGHLEDAKEPGHFVGKGYLKMSIDRIGLPTTDIPVRAKVISVSGYRVDKEGKVIGKGHATRDVVEWTLPPLWPWKILSLPAKGPRPTLKGEVRLTMRVMDDFIVPQAEVQAPQSGPALIPRLQPQKGWKRFGAPSYFQERSSNSDDRSSKSNSEVKVVPAVMTSGAAENADAQAVPAASATWPADVTVFQLKDGMTIPTKQYSREGELLVYALDGGEKGTAELDRVDWSATSKLNWTRGVRVVLRGQ
jgi:hypothetical protein